MISNNRKKKKKKQLYISHQFYLRTSKFKNINSTLIEQKIDILPINNILDILFYDSSIYQSKVGFKYPAILSLFLLWWNQDVKQIGKFSPETAHFVMREREKKIEEKKIARASIGPPGLSREITRRTCARMANSEKVALSRRWLRNGKKVSSADDFEIFCDKNRWYTGQETFGKPCDTACYMPGSMISIKIPFHYREMIGFNWSS